MKTKLILLIAVTIILVKVATAQTTDEETIKQTVRMETEAALKGDTTA